MGVRANAGTVAGALALAIVALFLRLREIGAQILLDDEWHAVRKLVSTDYVGIATSFGLADHSIPLTLFFKWVAERGWLSEATMLAPSWIAGVAACLFALWAARPVMPRPSLLLFAGLLAISPLAILYTRQARPYAITLLLGLVAIWAAYGWWATRRGRFIALYLATGIPAMYLHLVVAPMVLGVWVYFAIEWLAAGRRDASRFAAIAGWAVSSAALLAALLAPAVLNDWAVMAAKAARDRPDAETIVRAWLFMMGTASAWLGGFMLAMAIVGGLHLRRQVPRAFQFVATLMALQAASVLLSGALWVSLPLVLSRYLLLFLPFLLGATAMGMMLTIERLFGDRPIANAVVGTGLLAMAFATGPLPDALKAPNAFFTHHVYFLDFDPRHNKVLPVLSAGPIPAFYRGLGREPPRTLRLIEAPWRYESIFNRLALFQQVHRQDVEIGMVGNVCPPGAHGEYPRHIRHRFRHMVDLAMPVAELRRRADFVVLHKRLELSNMTREWLSDDGRPLPAVDGCVLRFRQEVGDPVFEDETIVVFDLRRGSAR